MNVEKPSTSDMLMPERYVSDTSAHCQTISQTKWLKKMIETCWTVTTAPSLWPAIALEGGATVTFTPGVSVVVDIPSLSGTASMSLSVTPGEVNELELTAVMVQGSGTVGVYEMAGGNEILLTSTTISASQQTSVTGVTFTPSGSEVTLKYKYAASGWKWHGHSVCILKPEMVSETFLVDVCDSVDDKYRFGFAAGEKINEIAGIGNYVDLGERGVDTRIARLNWRPDPLAAKFPYQSPYSYAGNNPIFYIDKNGKEIWIMELKSTGEAKEGVQYIDGKLYDKQGNEVTTNNKYINEIKSFYCPVKIDITN